MCCNGFCFLGKDEVASSNLASSSTKDHPFGEVREELGIEAEIIRPLWLNQDFFVEDVSGQKYHEICLYYLVDGSNAGLLQKGDRFDIYEGGKKHSFYWLSFEAVEAAYLYPKFIKRKIRDLPGELTLQAEFE